MSLPSIRSLRAPFFEFKCEQVDYRLRYLREFHGLDFDVFLPSIGKNLQRPFVWTVEQQREIVWSVLLGRKIDPIAVIHLADDTMQVIDGKQRLTSLYRFLDNKLSIAFEGRKYFFKDLPDDWRRCFESFHLSANRIYEMPSEKVSDQKKIDWFFFINFAGAAQEKAHMDSLRKI